MPSSKSYDEYVQGLYEAMLSDIASRNPGLRVECERDYKRLLSAINQMGLPFIVEVLPAFAKHLDQCLANGRLTPSHLAHFRPYNRRVVIPRLFKGLLLRVFDVNGVLRSNPDVQSIKDVRQLSLAFKRLRVNCPEPKVWKQIDEFFKIDNEVVHGTLDWDSDDFGPDGASDLQFGDHFPSEPRTPLFSGRGDSRVVSSTLARNLRAIQFVSDATCSEIGRFDPFDWRPRHGPGAVADQRSDGYKYSFPSWPAKLERVFPLADFAFANYAHWADYVSSVGGPDLFSRHEPPARLLAVPKSFSGPRLICSEPTAGQWCQQVVRDFLMSRVSHASLGESIDFNSQERNRDLAQEASDTQSHSTIDLSSASDRISCWLVERLFRRSPSLLSAAHSVRTRWVRQDIDKNSPSFHKLRKFTTMGSALTFPVQTYLFAAIAVGCVLSKRGYSYSYASVRKAASEVRVFGDDIIVPIDCHDDVVEALTHLGLKVNSAKTFDRGFFRESCGMEAYRGTDVTRVSFLSLPLVSKPEAVLSALDTHNNLLKAGWYVTAEYVRKTVADLKRFAFRFVDPSSGAVGWHSYFGESNSHLLSRWNEALHIREVRATVPCGIDRRIPVDSDAMVLQYFTECKGQVESDYRLGRPPLRRPLKLRWAWVQG